MPEGPSIIIAKEKILPFKGKSVVKASGSAKLDLSRVSGKIIDIKSWGKHLLICFKSYTIRIHFLMFGTYAINEEKKNRIPKLKIQFKTGELNFYACSVKFIEENLNEIYEWSADIMNDAWNAAGAKKN